MPVRYDEATNRLATFWQQLRGDIGLALPSERGNPWPPSNSAAAPGVSSSAINGLQHFVTIGEVEEIEAQGVKARYEYLLRLLKQRLLTLPPGMDIVTFLRHDGKPPDTTPESGRPEITFAQFRDGYLKTIGNGAVEKNTLYTV